MDTYKRHYWSLNQSHEYTTHTIHFKTFKPYKSFFLLWNFTHLLHSHFIKHNMFFQNFLWFVLFISKRNLHLHRPSSYTESDMRPRSRPECSECPREWPVVHTDFSLTKDGLSCCTPCLVVPLIDVYRVISSGKGKGRCSLYHPSFLSLYKGEWNPVSLSINNYNSEVLQSVITGI